MTELAGDTATDPSGPARRDSPWTVFLIFLRLGLTSFGGPVAHLGYYRAELVERRPGDVASLVADPSLADQEWGWRATRDLQSMCRDAWRVRQRQRQLTAISTRAS